MHRRIRLGLPALIAMLALLPANQTAAADVAPETLLAKESVAYLRYDGLATHRAAYEKTVFAGMLRDEFQPLVDEVSRLIFDAFGPQVLSERLLEGVPPAELIRLQSALKQVPRFVAQLKEHGFVLGVEVIEPLKGRFQVTVVFPGTPKTDPAATLAAFRLFGHLMEAKVVDVKIGSRIVVSMSSATPATLNCWKEGPHAVVTIGTEPPQRTIDLLEGRRASLTANPLFREVSGFRRYETWLRGFADVDAVGAIVRKAVPPAGAIISQLGLDGLRNVAFHLGFEGKLQRSTILVGTKGKRQGLLRVLTSPTTLDLKTLPAIAPDAVSVLAGTADFPAIFEEGRRVIRMAAVGFNPAAGEEFDKQYKAFEKSLGVDLKKDVIGALGSRYVLYSSPTEGALLLGTTLAVEVKDAAKLKQSLEAVVRSLSTGLGLDLSVKKRTYRGAELHVVDIGFGQGDFFPFSPTFAIHKGWLVVALYPQPVRGFVYRSGGRAAAFRPPALLARALKETLEPAAGAATSKKPPRLIGVGVSDPQYALKQVIAYAPLFVSFLRSAGESLKDFDVSTIPNGQAATERLTKNVTVTVDDGNAVRIEGYASLPFPTQLSGLDALTLFPLLQYLRFAF